jgi:lipopolysaccharide/colanic/teichoic acid biosynthesis glycosyltransferase
MGTQTSTRRFGGTDPAASARGAVDVVEVVPDWKRFLDLFLLLLLLPLVSPISILIVLYIKLVSSGPVLFSQTRIGFRRKPFTCYKFRSMKTNACVKGHEKHLENLMTSGVAMTKLDSTGDSRLIPGAAIFRASGLDELAQLLNVFKGDMSIVGPRPCLPYEFALYNEHHKQRLNALPGITGYWQVNGKNETTFEEMISMDVEYTQRQSVSMDLRIILRTFFVLIKQMVRAVSKRPESTPAAAKTEAARPGMISCEPRRTTRL